MKKSQLIKRILILLAIGTIAYSQTHGLYSVMNKIQKICKAYQIEVKMQDIRVERDLDNDLVLVLNLDARRTNYDSMMMVGFYSVAKALESEKNFMDIKKVSVAISIPGRQTTTIISTANIDDLIRLENGSLSADEFRNKIIII